MSKVTRIVIDFPVGVTVSREAHHLLVDAASIICHAYEQENPGRIMWPAEFGSQMLVDPMSISDDEPIPFDDTVEHIGCCEREILHDSEREERPPPLTVYHVLKLSRDIIKNLFEEQPAFWAKAPKEIRIPVYHIYQHMKKFLEERHANRSVKTE